MRTVDYLFSPDYADLFWPGVLAAILVAVMCATLSPLVVLKRMSFVGHGVSHAAFGGVGVVLFATALAGLTGWGALTQAMVSLFAIAAALVIAVLSRRRETDAAIGIVLAACMALGFILYRLAAERLRAAGLPPPPGIEDVLFGSVLSVGWAEVFATALVTSAVLGALWAARRPMVTWAFDEATAGSLGVRGDQQRVLLFLLLALAVVAAMQVAGVVLATAMLVLPGAIGLTVSNRLSTVVAVSIGSAVLGVGGGLIASFEIGQSGVQTGPAVVLVLVALLAVARLAPRPNPRTTPTPAV